MSQYIGRTGLAYARMWHHVDLAKDPRTLGRVATNIATVLMGKHKPIYHPSTDCGDYVVVTNCQYLYTTGNKMQTKLYRRHSGRPGNLKEQTMEDLMNRKGGGEVLRKAVSGMLPKNRLRKFRLERLKTFEGSQNGYAQNIMASYDMAPQVKTARRKMHQKPKSKTNPNTAA